MNSNYPLKPESNASPLWHEFTTHNAEIPLSELFRGVYDHEPSPAAAQYLEAIEVLADVRQPGLAAMVLVNARYIEWNHEQSWRGSDE